MTKTYSNVVANKIKSYMDENAWKYQFDSIEGRFLFEVALRNKIKVVHCIIDVQEDAYIVYGLLPFGIDPRDNSKLSTMAQYLCYINNGLKNGNFDLNPLDGEIRYKCYVDCEDVIPSDKVIYNSIVCPSAMIDLFGEGILAVMLGNASTLADMDKNPHLSLLSKILSIMKSDKTDVSDDDEGIVLDTTDISAGGHYA